jgi:hypothetical protein
MIKGRTVRIRRETVRLPYGQTYRRHFSFGREANFSVRVRTNLEFGELVPICFCPYASQPFRDRFLNGREAYLVSVRIWIGVDQWKAKEKGFHDVFLSTSTYSRMERDDFF